MADSRELHNARQAAEDALDEYARLAFDWNNPDCEYTRLSIMAMAKRAIEAHDPEAIRALCAPASDAVDSRAVGSVDTSAPVGILAVTAVLVHHPSQPVRAPKLTRIERAQTAAYLRSRGIPCHYCGRP